MSDGEVERCEGCGSKWRVGLEETNARTAELVQCPICRKPEEDD